MNLNKIKCKTKHLSPHKAVEFRLYKSGLIFKIEDYLRVSKNEIFLNSNLFNILSYEVRFTRRCDRAGCYISITLFGYNFSFEWYDKRQYDNRTNTWF